MNFGKIKIAQREFLALNSIFGFFKREFWEILALIFLFSWLSQDILLGGTAGVFPMIHSIFVQDFRKILKIVV